MKPLASTYTTVSERAQAEFEEKRSIFIGYATHIDSEEEALAFVKEIKKEHRDATHCVFAYLLGDGTVARYSDDGEPQGTAGMPVLNVLKMSGATDLCVVVTRYFGGILLGAGGLVRAYSASAKQAIDEAGFASFEDYAVYKIDVTYSDYQKLTVALGRINAEEDHVDFGEGVTVIAAIEKSRMELIPPTVSELTYGKDRVELLGFEERASRID